MLYLSNYTSVNSNIQSWSFIWYLISRWHCIKYHETDCISNKPRNQMEYLFLGETIRTITITNNGVFVSKRNNPYQHNRQYMEYLFLREAILTIHFIHFIYQWMVYIWDDMASNMVKPFYGSFRDSWNTLFFL